MQCRRCEFENLPDAPRCLRCGAALVVPPDFPVEPPRAGARVIAYGVERRVRTVFGSIGRVCGAIVGALRIRGDDALTPSVNAVGEILHSLVISIIPGLPQWRAGRKTTGRILFYGWLVLLALSIPFPWPLGLAVAVHVFSIADVYFTTYKVSTFKRLVIPLILFAVMWFLVYMPISALLGRFAFRLWVPAGAISGRNVSARQYLVYFARGGRPRTGQLVEYFQPAMMNAQAAPGDNEHVYVQVQGGLSLGYVAAEAGDTVSFEKSALLGNGAPLSVLRDGSPLASLKWPSALNGMSISVPPSSAFVVPLDVRPFARVPDAPTMRRVVVNTCLVDTRAVAARACFVVRPVDQVGFL